MLRREHLAFCCASASFHKTWLVDFGSATPMVASANYLWITLNYMSWMIFYDTMYAQYIYITLGVQDIKKNVLMKIRRKCSKFRERKVIIISDSGYLVCVLRYEFAIMEWCLLFFWGDTSERMLGNEHFRWKCFCFSPAFGIGSLWGSAFMKKPTVYRQLVQNSESKESRHYETLIDTSATRPPSKVWHSFADAIHGP